VVTIIRSAITPASCRRPATRRAMSPSPSAGLRRRRVLRRFDALAAANSYPEMSAKFDVDQAQAATTRRHFWNAYCDSDTLCCTAHFPSPSTGKIRRSGSGLIASRFNMARNSVTPLPMGEVYRRPRRFRI